MVKLPRKVAYVFEAVLEIAQSSNSGPLPSRTLSDRQKIPARYLEQALQRLVRTGILKGVRGPRGGYLLARSPQDITLREIAQTVVDAERSAGGQAFESKSLIGTKVIQPLFDDLERQMMATLERRTVADLMEQAATADKEQTSDLDDGPAPSEEASATLQRTPVA